MGEEEFPIPDPDSIEELFSKIRKAAPEVDVLHIDNVNPGTIARHPEESRKVAKTIIKYHTTGDVAAFGLESLDPEVIKRNNLKVTEEEALAAIRILNEVGNIRPSAELPHLLPGINLLYGLLGERRQTMDYNLAFLERLVEDELVVRRINIRQVIGFPNTRIVHTKKKGGLKPHQFFSHKKIIREKIDKVMIKRVTPYGTIIRSAFCERKKGNHLLLRPLGSYPLLCHMPLGVDIPQITDVFVVDHGPRSVTVLPYPLDVRKATMSQLKTISGIGGKRAARLKAADFLNSIDDIETCLDTQLPDWLKHTIQFD